MKKEEIEEKIRDFFKLNNKDFSDEAIENYIYVSAYNQLCRDMYGQSPIEKMKEQSNNTQNNSVIGGKLKIKSI